MNNLMTIKFDSNLDYQNDAINSVVNIFKTLQTNKTKVLMNSINNLLDEGCGFSNNILNSNYLDIINENIKSIQLKNNLPINDKKIDNKNDLIFDIEMETGTGKTYVFLKTILELNKQYNFTKFVIVVPTIAIREGVLKNLEITKNHFLHLYNNVNYHYFVYNSSRLSDVRNFSTSSDIEIMIINIQNFEKEKNIFNNYKEQLAGDKPVDLVNKTNPIVIIDEPQTTASTEKAMNVIYSLNPLFILRYSATFRKDSIKNLVYRLDPIDAYERKLVKQIEVDSYEIKNDDTSKIYVVKIDKNCSSTTISYFDKYGNKKKSKFLVGQNIYSKSLREEHKEFLIEEISTNYVAFHNGMQLEIDSSNNKTDDKALITKMIQKLIETHLDKQLYAKKDGIKVLSLFFLDEVKNYRIYNDDSYELGEYGKIFETMFKIVAKRDKYKSLFENINIDEYASKVHNGYFAIDKKKHFKDSKINNGEGGKSSDDELAYNLIMRDKERLLSFNEPVSFIFSHTALKEGWDNPNIFQIYVLSKSNTTIKKRQQIGRGLRLCVDQNGNRVRNPNINRLTIFSNESFAKFAKELQTEFIDETSCFNLNNNSFVLDHIVDLNLSIQIYNNLIANNFIDNQNRPTDKLYEYLEIGKNLFDNYCDEINNHIKNILSKRFIRIKNAKNYKKNSINQSIKNNKDFLDLWTSISKIKKLNVTFNDEDYLNEIKENINKKIELYSSKNLILKHSNIEINRDKGVQIKNEIISNNFTLESEFDFQVIPKIINNLVQTLNIKKSSLIDLILNTNLVEKVKDNPYFAERILIDSIKNVKNSYKISYFDTNENYDKDKLFSSIDSIYLDDKFLYTLDDINIDRFSHKTLYKYTKLQSQKEYNFLNDAINNDDVLTILKLPYWYHIPMPNGNYIPDFALKINDKNKDKYVIEIKGSVDNDELRFNESFKILCGEKYFEGNKNISFKMYSDVNKLLNYINFEKNKNK